MQSYEYREFESKTNVRCEIVESIYGDQYKDLEPLKILVFKIVAKTLKPENSQFDQSEFADSRGMNQKF